MVRPRCKISIVAVLCACVVASHGASAQVARTAAAGLAATAPAAAAAKKGPVLHNWNWTYNTTYGVCVNATSIKQIQDIIADPKAYPSPVMAVGNMHSVTPIMTNPDGTIINLLRFNKVLNIDKAGLTVSVEAGITLADLHDALAKEGYEISFSPEIGDATVGSLCVTTSKDSSIKGPGYLTALIKAVTYADQTGKLVTLQPGGPSFDLFTASWGVAGIVTNVTFTIRPQVAVVTRVKLIKFDPDTPAQDLKLAQSILDLKKQADNLFITTDPNSGWAFVEMRSLATCPTPAACAAVMKNTTNRLQLEGLRRLKYDSFLVGTMPAGLLNTFGRAIDRLPVPIAITHYRKTLVNRYPKVTPKDKRLDFTYFEFQDNDKLDLFVDVYTSSLQFVRDFAKQTGFKPGGLATYFVTRPGTKKHGSYRGSPGISFMLDPLTGTPDNPQWYAFLAKFNDFIFKKKTSLFALSQTKLMTPAQLAEQKGLIPGSLAQPRFTTPFLAQFVAKSTTDE